MIHLADIMMRFMPILAKSGAAQRWQALRGAGSPSAGGGNQTWQWVVMTAIFVVLIAIIVFPILVYFHKRFVVLMGVLRTALATPNAMSTATDTSLTTSDVELLTRLIRESGFIRPEMEFTVQHAFNVGKANYLGSDDYSEMAGDLRRDVTERVDDLEKKLSTNQQEGIVTTRQIPVGAHIVSSGDVEHDEFNMIVRANTDKGLQVEPPFLVESPSDSPWILRYFDGVRVWGFTSPVIGMESPCLILEHTDDMEVIHFRRFARVAVDCIANVCRFMFHATAEEETSLSFVRANVIEIGGPGILLKTTLQARVGDRILIQLQLMKNEVIQAIGKIRRRNDMNLRSNWHTYGVELVGLKPAQVAELMQATNSAAIQHHKKEEQEELEQQEESSDTTDSSDTTQETSTVSAT